MRRKIIFICSLLFIIIVFQFLPDWFFKSISILVLLTCIAVPTYNYFGRKRLYKFIEDTINSQGYELLSITEYQEHFGVKFTYQGVKYYSKCSYAKKLKEDGIWLDGSPCDVVSRKTNKQINQDK